METAATKRPGVNHDPGAIPNVLITSFDQFARYLVPHDQRMIDLNPAFVDFDIGPAHAAVGHSDQDMIVIESRPFNVFKPQIAGTP